MIKKLIVVFNDSHGFQGVLREGVSVPRNQDDYIDLTDYQSLFGMSFDTIADYDNNTYHEDTLDMIQDECREYELEPYIIV